MPGTGSCINRWVSLKVKNILKMNELFNNAYSNVYVFDPFQGSSFYQNRTVSKQDVKMRLTYRSYNKDSLEVTFGNI